MDLRRPAAPLIALAVLSGAVGDARAAVGSIGDGMRCVEAVARKLRIKRDEFAVYYLRPDGAYDGWNLWLWKQGGSGARHEFTGVRDGVAYFRTKRADFFDARAQVLGLIVRTDSWAKDPGVDQFYSIANGNQCVVFSGVPDVYALGADRPARMIVKEPPEPKPAPELSKAVMRKLPEPIIDGHEDWIELYWAAWKFMHEKISRGHVKNGFVPLYIDEGFNENIYQWDSCFMAAYAMYGLDVFPAMPTLDNFYQLQRASDGYICRCYNENTGRATGENDINPPLFAWMEARYVKLTGDTSRLARVLPHLDSYFQWVKANARSDSGHGLYFITDLGSGMDNSPREEFIRRGAWVDLSSQQALAALSIARLAAVAGDARLAAKYREEYSSLKKIINDTLWSPDSGMYFDRKEDGSRHERRTIASFWPMVAEVASADQAKRMIAEHLKNPKEFFRDHLFPTLAEDDPVYDGRGHYWRGAVWAPTNFAVVKGIERYDRGFAYEAARNHIENMARVLSDFRPDAYDFKMPALTEPNIPRNGDGIRQIWEAYAPDYPAPATRWDAKLLVRQKFCGWSGLGPVALLIENVLGFDVDAPANTVTWRVNLSERHGIRRLKMGKNAIDLVAEARRSAADPVTISARGAKSFRLVVYVGASTETVLDRMIPAGKRIRVTTGS